MAETRAFFGPRAAGWEQRFPDDGPRYRQAVAELAPPPGGVALDAACGTGRGLPYLAAAVGAGGRVVAVDLTPEMLTAAQRAGRGELAGLVLGDVRRLPLPDRSVDAVFATGLLPHLGDPQSGLAELGRVCRPGGRLALFHPIGRAALAARHGRRLDPDDARSPAVITALLTAAGWKVVAVDDAADRYLAIALRSGGVRH